MAIPASIYISLLAISSHVVALVLLAVRRAQLPPYSNSPPTTWRHTLIIPTIHCVGLISAVSTLAWPYTFRDDPTLQPALRCVSFFYACKILDLTLTRARQPPTLMQDNQNESNNRVHASLHSVSNHMNYSYRLLTEMRFPSFDMAIKQKERPAPGKDSLSSAWTWMTPLVIFISNLLLPIAELRCLGVLLLIQLGLESLHKTVHFGRKSCHEPLFYKPFAANSFGSFWMTHWHAAAAPFLQSLAYQPGKRFGGRWLGVLATFNLTGLWHAWASAPLVQPERALELAFKVWMMFMIMGLGILAERVVWGTRQGGMVQRLVVWVVAVSSAAWAYRVLECHSRITILRSDRCT